MKLVDKLLKEIRFDKRYLLYMFLIVLIGVLTGSLFIIILNNTDKALVIEYIEEFIKNIKNSNIDNIVLFKNTIINNIFFIVLIWILGLTFILFPLNILIIFYKSFLIGFSISSFILTLGLKGIILGIIYIFPHLIINICLFCLLTAYSTKLSINMIKYIKHKKNLNIAILLKKYICVLLLVIFLISISSAIETFFTPKLLSLVKFIY